MAARRHLHQYPEVGFEEYQTGRYLKSLLDEYGLRVHGPYGGTGFAVDIIGAHPGPTIGYRTELDALPAQDAKSVPYSSRHRGVAHLCGHDAHMATAFGVALLLDRNRARLHGTVRVLFQPNEEGIPTGAPKVIQDGGIDGLKEIFCIHVDPTLDVGRFGLRSGPVTAATASWMVHIFNSQSGHSARPHETIDTVWLASQILSGFYQLPGRIHDARRTAVLTATRFHAGEALNVIPDRVQFGGTLRAVDMDTMRFLSSRMREMVEHLGALHGAEVRYEVDLGLPPVINDRDLVGAINHIASELQGPEQVHWIPEPSMGGEDFAFYLQHIPGALVRVGTRGGPDSAYPLHHALFDIDERALPLAAHLMSEVLIRRLATG